MIKIRNIILLLLSVATLSVAADSAYLSKNTKVYKDKNKKEIIGELFVASKVKIISKNDDLSKIEFIGYAPEDSPIVYEKAGFLIKGFEGKDFSKYKIIGKKIDEYDNEWFEVLIKGFIQNEVLTPKKESVIIVGKNLFEAKCGICHDIHSKEEFIPNVWPSILDNMSAQAGLSNDERMKIEKYLQAE